MGNVEILVKGKNKEILFNKLKRAKINVKKIKIVDEKSIIIVVKEKDCEKVFAILGNMWYNKIIRYSGIILLFNYIKKRLISFIGVLIFLAVTLYCKSLIYSIEINGIINSEKQTYYTLLEQNGIKKFQAISNSKMEEIKNIFLSNNSNFSYVTVNKSANRLIINVFQEKLNNELVKFDKNIISNTNGIIRKIITLKGTAKKNIGDKVNVGEVLIEGQIYSGEKMENSFAFGYVEIESNFFYEEKVESFSEENKSVAINKAKFLCSHLGDIEKVEIKENSQLLSYEILVTYIVKIGE